ncbi:MAG: hypothetical protein U1F36_14875 [Planctomycetota bacterium]
MRVHLRSGALALSCVASLTAQSYTVSPEAMTNAYGGINNSIPWGPFVPSGNTTGEIMVQQIDNELQGQVLILQGMAFRHQYTSTHVAKSFQATVTLADAASNAAGISTTFANNYKPGGNQGVVFAGAINFPAVGPIARPPAPFDSPVAFTTPYVHLGTDPLMWEVIILSSTPVTPTQFYERGPGTTIVAGAIGNGCTIAGGSTPLTATGSCTATQLSNNLANGPLGAPATLMYGDSSGLLGGTTPLPVNLGFLGSPSCFLEINPFAFESSATSATGTATSSLSYVLSPATSGIRLRTQWVAIDGFTLVTSNGLDFATPFNATSGKPWPLGRVYANGFGVTPPASGSIQANGLVTQWIH